MTGFITIEREHGQLYRVSSTGNTPIQITFGASNGGADWKGTTAGSTNLVNEIENTVTFEMTSIPPIIETTIHTDTPYIEPTETPSPLTATPETEDITASEEIVTPTIVETMVPTDILEIPPTEVP